MLLAKIVGTVVATRKDPRLVSNKLLLVRPVDPKGKAEGNHLVAVDTVDAGVGETVLIVSGSNDTMLPDSNAYFLFKHLGNAQLILYPDSGHGVVRQSRNPYCRAAKQFPSHALG